MNKNMRTDIIVIQCLGKGQDRRKERVGRVRYQVYTHNLCRIMRRAECFDGRIYGPTISEKANSIFFYATRVCHYENVLNTGLK